MQALSKKLYYDVVKGSREDTILESDSYGDNCDREYSRTSDVGCYVRTHLKSNEIQTDWFRNNDTNFRNECTATTEVDSLAVAVETDSLIQGGEGSILCIPSYDDIAITRGHSSPVTCEGKQYYPLLKNRDPVVVFQCLDQLSTNIKKSVPGVTSKATLTETPTRFHSCRCLQTDMGTCSCDDDYQYIPCKRGLAACHAFTLGTAEFRRLQREQCNTKLIGGCRVPVCKNYQSRY